jgi:hypothetical protein
MIPHLPGMDSIDTGGHDDVPLKKKPMDAGGHSIPADNPLHDAAGKLQAKDGFDHATAMKVAAKVAAKKAG